MTQTKPQRITPPAAPGALHTRAFGLAQRIKLRDSNDRDPVYLALLRQCPCLKCGLDPCGEAAHVRFNSGAHGKHNGMGKKPADRFALPLCAGCHREDNDAQHRVGELEFWHRVGLNPLLTAAKLYAAKGDMVRMRAVVFEAVAARS